MNMPLPDPKIASEAQLAAARHHMLHADILVSFCSPMANPDCDFTGMQVMNPGTPGQSTATGSEQAALVVHSAMKAITDPHTYVPGTYLAAADLLRTIADQLDMQEGYLDHLRGQN